MWSLKHSFWKNIFPKGLKLRKLDGAMLLSGLILGGIFHWSLPEVVVFLFFLGSVLFSVPARLLAVVAAGVFFAAPIYMLLGYEKSAEQIALYAYYLLAIMATQALLEISQQKDDKQADI